MTYTTHPFRPIVGNAAFCADCPPRESYGATHPWHMGHEPVPLDQVVTGFQRIPSETLIRELDRRPCHVIRRDYQIPATYRCTPHRSTADTPDVHGPCRAALKRASAGRLTLSAAGRALADSGFEEDMMPRNICGNCLAKSTRANPVRLDVASNRRLCASCSGRTVPA